VLGVVRITTNIRKLGTAEGASHLGVRADAETLKQIPLFRSCEAVPLQVLAFAAERVRFGAGDTFMKEGIKGAAAYFILSGSADVIQAKQKIGLAEPGALLGEMSMVGGQAYSLSAVAAEPLSAVRIDHALFMRVADEYPDFGRAVLEALSEKLARSVRELDGVRGMLTKARSFSQL
jgi:CRP/FNR family transcriptional regulator, cyclic AMP receptor protein